MVRFYIIAIFVLILSCNSGKDKPDVSGIDVDIKVERFEDSFFKIDTNNITQGLAQLSKQYPRFYPTFMQDIIGINPTDASSLPVIKTIIQSYAPIFDSLHSKYKNMNGIESELQDAFKYVKHYYPQYKVPGIITYIGTFDAPGVILTPNYLGIGLHQFAGKNFSAYSTDALQQLYPTYISRRFDKEYITINAMKAVADDIYPDASVGRPLIEQMIEKGKQWFLLDKFLPDAPDSLKTGYTQKQLEWVTENEGNVWGYVIKNENIYSIEPHVIQSYLGESPFTQGMPEASPGNIGQWIGWQIVQKYASENKEMSLQQILQTPPKNILDGAKYRPK